MEILLVIILVLLAFELGGFFAMNKQIGKIKKDIGKIKAWIGIVEE